jgi:hypothetical protein
MNIVIKFLSFPLLVLVAQVLCITSIQGMADYLARPFKHSNRILKSPFHSMMCNKSISNSVVFCLESKAEVEVTLRLTVSQSVLVSSILVGLATRYYFLSKCCCLKFAVLYLLGALSDERTGLQFAV